LYANVLNFFKMQQIISYTAAVVFPRFCLLQLFLFIVIIVKTVLMILFTR